MESSLAAALHRIALIAIGWIDDSASKRIPFTIPKPINEYDTSPRDFRSFGI